MKKILAIILLFLTFDACAQMSQFYKRKIAESFELTSGTVVGFTVKITDSLSGGLWMQTTRNIPYGTTVRYAISHGWLVPTSSGGSSAGVYTWKWIGVDTTAINTSDKYFVGYSDGFTVDSLVFHMRRLSGSPDVTAILWYGSDINSSGTAIVAGGNQITSYTGGTRTGTITNATIAKGNVVWLTFSAVSVRPKGFFVSIKGHN